MELGAAEGWGRDSSSLGALPHGMEVHTCVATLSPHTASQDAPHPKTAGGTGRPALKEGALAATERHLEDMRKLAFLALAKPLRAERAAA